MTTKSSHLLLDLLRSALSNVVPDSSLFLNLGKEAWQEVYNKICGHALAPITFEVITKLPKECTPPRDILLPWYAMYLKQSQLFKQQRQVVQELTQLWNQAGIKVKELKGQDVGRLYPHPELRYSCDFDCFLSDFELGNQIVEAKGIKVDRGFYKNSSFFWKGVYVENHQFCTPVRGNREMKRLELTLRNNLDNANFNALFLMEHMWSHFFEDALSLKQVLDWVVFRERCWKDVDKSLFECEAKACGFWNFSKSIEQIVEQLLQKDSPMQFEDKYTQRLWEQIWTGGGSVEMNNGWRTRIQLFVNYFRNGWRYRAFSNHSAFYVLLRTIAAFLFDRTPKIN